MTKPARKDFQSTQQWKRYLGVKKFFEKLISLKDCLFLVDNEPWSNPYINGLEMGFKEEGVKFLFIGGDFVENKTTGEMDVPYVYVGLRELRERIIPLQRIRI